MFVGQKIDEFRIYSASFFLAIHKCPEWQVGGGRRKPFLRSFIEFSTSTVALLFSGINGYKTRYSPYVQRNEKTGFLFFYFLARHCKRGGKKNTLFTM